MDAVSRLDLYGIGRRFLLQYATTIDPSVVDVAGSDANLFVGSQSFVAHAVVRQLQDRFAAFLAGAAVGDDLDRLFWDRYRLPRKGASPALGGVRFFRFSTAAGAGVVPVGQSLTTRTGVEYVTTTTATFGAADFEATCDVSATAAGKASQVGTNQITNIANASALFDPTLQVTNDAPTAGGEEREDDPTYRDRGQNFWPSARRGTLGAIAFGALTVPGVASAAPVEVLDGGANPARVVQLYVGDSSGVASRALGDQVDAALLDFRAAGIQVVTALSIPVIVPVKLQLAFAAGTSTSPLTDLIRAAVVGYVNSLPTNGTLFRLALGAVLSRYQPQGLVLSGSSIVDPTGDVVPAPGQTLRTTLAQVTTQ